MYHPHFHSSQNSFQQIFYLVKPAHWLQTGKRGLKMEYTVVREGGGGYGGCSPPGGGPAPARAARRHTHSVCVLCAALCCAPSAAPCCTVVWGIDNRNKNHLKLIKKRNISPRDLGLPARLGVACSTFCLICRETSHLRLI